MPESTLSDEGESLVQIVFQVARLTAGFEVEGLRWRKRCPSTLYLTECIDQFVLEVQLPHKIVSLLFTITH